MTPSLPTAGAWDQFGAWWPLGAEPQDRLLSLLPILAMVMSAPNASAARPTLHWDDQDWMRARAVRHGGGMPLSFYRLDAAPWFESRFPPPLDWERLAQELVPYVADLGFTHVALDTALMTADDTAAASFVETCHVAGVGVVVRDDGTSAGHASHGVDASGWRERCRRLHLDGFEETPVDGRPARCWLFVDAEASQTLRLDFRPRWRQANTAYLAYTPDERTEHHDAWVEALTPVENGRGILEQSPSGEAPIGRWRRPTHGDAWQRFATLRATLATMWALPGEKWLSMGVEFGQDLAEPFDKSMHWPLLLETPHAGMLRLVADLNRLYVNELALQVRDNERYGFRWLVSNDSDNNIVIFARRAESGHGTLLCISNFDARVHHGYRFGVPAAGRWREIFNSDSVFYGGSNVGNGRVLNTDAESSHGWSQSLSLIVPPMATLFLRHEIWYEEGL
ncbi:alpha amylase C-terminal domain-containing protein [Salinicola aestuarinus]|uniref:alpha amylase C-terminal domain-containing protein n=1 Tax=Salinicola aestuarinus TaxID=1949082 RepID=UPI000DA13DB4|nr:alpha amylase C-terminal domain-containing protein [Salinicola aestuarinus]